MGKGKPAAHSEADGSYAACPVTLPRTVASRAHTHTQRHNPERHHFGARQAPSCCLHQGVWPQGCGVGLPHDKRHLVGSRVTQSGRNAIRHWAERADAQGPPLARATPRVSEPLAEARQRNRFRSTRGEDAPPESALSNPGLFPLSTTFSALNRNRSSDRGKWAGVWQSPSRVHR